jgi:carboxymethylenebutenolidase
MWVSKPLLDSAGPGPEGTPASREDAFSYARTLSATTHVSDANAFVAWLGGPIVMRTAATLPKRIGAGCTFHGGGLTTINPDSPHLLIPNMKASMLIAIADNDDQKDPTSKEILRRKALA